MTIRLSLAALALGLLFGLLGASAKVSDKRVPRLLGGFYTSVVRGVPETVWGLMMYFGTVSAMNAIGAWFGNPKLSLSPFVAGTFALALCFGAYATEVFRGALLAIPKGQKEAGQALGGLRHLVCGAAGNFVAPAEAMSPKGFKTVVDIDLIGAYNAAHAAYAQLAERGGSILFISGGQSYVPFKYQAHVGAAKAGIDMLMRDLALEWSGRGIRVNSLVPGPVQGTEGMRRLSPDGDEAFWAELVPMGRLARAEEIGQMAVVLASPLASFVSGALLPVDGGQNLTGSALFNQQVERLVAGGASGRPSP